MRSTSSLLFLDFDGVLCDSILECFVSSWHAYFTLYLKSPGQSVSLNRKQLFTEYRPFIRTGEDYVLLQELITRGIELYSQDDFDHARDEAGEAKRAGFRKVFYQTREMLLRDDRQWWLSLNILYEGLRELLIRQAANPAVHILSTKKPEFIAEILRAQDVGWPEQRIHNAGSGSKISFIRDFLDSAEADKAVFVDDQRDHLEGGPHNAIDVRLAEWGYVKQEWLSRSDIRTLSFKEFTDLLREF